MPPARVIIHSYQSKLDALFERGKSIEDFEVKAHWTRYLCILTSGFLEVSLRSITGQYARDNAHPNVANFVASQTEAFHNPSMTKILGVVRCFNGEWAKEMESTVEGEVKDSVDSIVNNRHSIAHGEWTGLSYSVMVRYYASAKKLADLLLTRFGL